jgi:hypothetical protein
VTLSRRIAAAPFRWWSPTVHFAVQNLLGLYLHWCLPVRHSGSTSPRRVPGFRGGFLLDYVHGAGPAFVGRDMLGGFGANLRHRFGFDRRATRPFRPSPAVATLLRFDLDSSPGLRFQRLPPGPTPVQQICKYLILKELVALTRIGPVFAGLSCFL